MRSGKCLNVQRSVEPIAKYNLPKQDYLIRRILHQEVTVIGSSRVYKALRDQMAITLAELKRIEAGQVVDDELLDVIRMMTVILGGMKKEEV